MLLRSLVVWLMLLALPYQGYASAAMMLCAPNMGSAARAMPIGPHDHAAMMAAMHDTPDGASQDASRALAQHNSAHPDAASSGDAGHSDHAHGGSKCGGAACCVAGAPMMTMAIAVPTLPAVSSAVPFYSEVLQAVDLAHPERPPQGKFV